jgi:hypothetical protein
VTQVAEFFITLVLLGIVLSLMDWRDRRRKAKLPPLTEPADVTALSDLAAAVTTKAPRTAQDDAITPVISLPVGINRPRPGSEYLQLAKKPR